MIVDAHLHVWDLTAGSYPWLANANVALNRTFGIFDAEPMLEHHQVDHVVLIQAADNEADLAVMLTAADHSARIGGVVAWGGLDRPQTFPDRLAQLVDHHLVVGVRDLIHDREPGWLLADDRRASLSILEASPLTFDFVCSSPAALAELVLLAERHPDLDIVIDHLGKPPIDGGIDQRREWRRLLTDAAANPRTSAKLSGFQATGADPAAWRPSDARPFIEDALELFGPQRLMFGSDWPVSTVSGGYGRTVAAVRDAIAGLSESDRSDVLGGTAARIYRLDRKDFP